MAKLAADFDKIIKDGRERKKNETLANKIFSRGRRQSAPSKLKSAPAAPSLASRVGVKKPQQQPRAARASLPAGNINGEWTHDLHNAGSPRGGSLGSRITAPGAAAKNLTPRAANRRKSRLATALDRMDIDEGGSSNAQVNVIKPKPAQNLTIRGLAGPFSVMAQNFAPGTTAADIESAMTPVGGEMASCRIVKTSPFILVEMEFASREGGERVIETFNNNTADGRVIRVWAKAGGKQPAAERSNAPANAPNGPRASRNNTNDQVIDGSMGFSVDLTRGSSNNSLASRTSQPLYSDKIVAGARRGRGGRGGR